MGETNEGLMKTARAQKVAKKERNRRVLPINAREWRFKRIAKVQYATKFAAAAKAYRTALGVTQKEVAREYGVTDMTVSYWESGTHYFGWSETALRDYIAAIDTIVRRG